MKFLPLIWVNLKRRKLRSIFTLLSVIVAFSLLGVLATVKTSLSSGVEVADADRMIVSHKVSIILPLPISYLDKIKEVPGVEEVAHASWFGGIYQDPRNFFPQIAVSETYLDLYPEYEVPVEELEAWLGDRTGALVGKATADRFGFRVGDRIPIQATFNVKKDGSRSWEFNVDGIYSAGKKGVDTSALLFHHTYLDEARAGGEGMVGWYLLRVTDPSRAQEVARDVDALFANSPFETKTSSEKAFLQAFADQIGNIGAIVSAIGVAVFFTLLLVTGNTMAQSVRERTNELAVLRTLGFSRRHLVSLVLAESLFFTAVGGSVGLLLAWLFTLGGDPTGGRLPVFYLPGSAVTLGALLTAVMGIAAGVLPALYTARLLIVDALRRI